MSDCVIEASGLTKYYGSTLAVDHLDLAIPRGCICGFLGRNGAGKTTAIKLLLGLLRPTVGSSQILGCDSQALTPAVRQRIGYVTEGHRLPRWMSIAQLERFQRRFFPGQWDDRLFADMIEYFGLPPKARIKRLSNGQRAQVSLALALAPNPELLIMDDPTLGLDAAIRREFLQGMIRLIMRDGRSVLFSSHILGDVERVADRIVVMDKGVRRADCSLDAFRSAVAKAVFRFAGTPPTEVEHEALIGVRRGETEVEVAYIKTDAASLNSWAESLGAESHEDVPMTLEDQFIEFTAPTGQKRVFPWEER